MQAAQVVGRPILQNGTQVDLKPHVSKYFTKPTTVSLEINICTATQRPLRCNIHHHHILLIQKQKALFVEYGKVECPFFIIVSCCSCKR